MSVSVRDVSQQRKVPTLSVDAYGGLPDASGYSGFSSDWSVGDGVVTVDIASGSRGAKFVVPIEDFKPILAFLNKNLSEPVTEGETQSQVEINDQYDEIFTNVLEWGVKITNVVEDLQARVEALETPPAVEQPTKPDYPEWTSDMRIYHEGDHVTMDGVDYVAAMDCEPNRGDEWYGNHISCWKVVTD